MRSLVLFLIFISATTSHAAIKLQSISGYSRLSGFASGGTNTNVRILGGFAGDPVKGNCAAKTGASTCNNCIDNDPYSICNETLAYNDLTLSLTFASTTVAIGTPKITVQLTGTTDFPVNPITAPRQTTAPNQLSTVDVKWGTIVDIAVNQVGGSDCSTSPCTLTLLFGLDAGSDNLKNGTGDDVATATLVIYNPPASFQKRVRSNQTECTAGVCNYSLFPGDSKASIENLTFHSPPDGLAISSLIFLCVEGTDFTLIPSYGEGLRKATVVGTSLNKDTIEGFSNLVTYSCRTAIEDEAGNIGLFSVDNPLADTEDKVCPDPTDTTCHQVRPDAVVALFQEKQNCFIATAAYGTPWMTEVQTLRKFRGDYLYKSAWGRAFTHWYYRNAPPVAQWISESPNRRLGARIVLTPIFATAYLLVNWPKTTFIFIIGLLIAFIFRRFYILRTR
jgi:hypothetical protein